MAYLFTDLYSKMAQYSLYRPSSNSSRCIGIIFSVLFISNGCYSQQATLDWFTFFGGSEQDVVNGVEKFPDGGFVSFGYTRSPDNIAIGNAHQSDFLGVYNDFLMMDEPNAFLTRWNDNGTPLWSTYYGGELYTDITGGAVFSNGNIAVTGHTFSPTNIATPGAFIENITDGGDIPPFKSFLSLFSPSGELLWGTYFGTGNKTRTRCLTVDDLGNIYIGGHTGDENLSTPGAWQSTPNGSNSSGFIAKFNSSGVQLWCTYFGTPSLDVIWQIEIDNNQNLMIAGSTTSLTGIASAGAHLGSGSGTRSLFLASFTSEGQRNWSTYVSSNTEELNIAELAVDNNGDAYIAGVTKGNTGIGTPGSYQENYPMIGIVDKSPFLCKYSQNGDKIWGTYAYLSQFLGINLPADLRMVSDGTHLYLSLRSSSEGDGTPYGLQPFQPNNAGGDDNFIFIFDSNGFPFSSSFFGGNDSEQNGLVVPLSSTQYVVTGTTYSNDFYESASSWQGTIAGSFDSYFGVITDVTLGLNSLSKKGESFKVFPNPGANYFSIEWPEELSQNTSDLIISNLSGIEVMRISNYSRDEAVTHSLHPGFYLLTLVNNKTTFNSKLVVSGR